MITKNIRIIFSILLLALSIAYLVLNQTKKPKVSVLMLTYERANILSSAIDSILNQTYKDFELIILNDGSTDNTDEIIKPYLKKDKRIRYYQNSSNKGIPYSRNKALKLARGKYITFMDDDDYSYPTKLEKQVAFIKSSPHTDVVIGQIENTNTIPQTHDEIVSHLISYNNIGNVNIMFKNDFIKKHNIKFDETFVVAEDWDFWLQMMFKGAKFASIPDVVIKRNWDSKRHYKASSFEINNPKIRERIGLFFSPTDSEGFYKASPCRKIFMLKRKNIISTQFYQNIKTNNNCP